MFRYAVSKGNQRPHTLFYSAETMYKTASEFYISGGVQDGPVETTSLVRGPYPEHKGKSAYPLHPGRLDDYRTILEGEMVLSYNQSMSPSDGGACTTSSFNGFDTLEKDPNNSHMLAFKLTLKAHECFSYVGFNMYRLAQNASGAVTRSGVITTRNNSGSTLQVGQAVCWRCEDPQKVGNEKARPIIITLTEMRSLVTQYERDMGVRIDPLLRHSLLTPFGRVMKTSPNGKDVKIQTFP